MLVLELLTQIKMKSFHRLVSINCCKNSASIKVGQFTIYKFPFQKNFLSMEKFSSWEKLDLPNLEKSFELLWFLTNFGKWRIKIREGLIWCLILLLFFRGVIDINNQNNDYKRPQRPFKNDSFATRGFPILFLLKIIVWRKTNGKLWW